jgi:hypothetical protein
VAGHGHAAKRLVELLADSGHIEELQARANAGDRYATVQLARWLEQHGRIDHATEVLWAAADDRGDDAAIRLTDLLMRHGRITELRTRSDNGDLYATEQLSDWLAKHGRTAEAIELLRQANDEDRYTERLVKLLDNEARTDEAIDVLRRMVDSRSGYGAKRLVELLAKQGRTDELQERADAGDRYAANRLTDLLAEEGRRDELQARADAGDRYATRRLVDLLADERSGSDVIIEVLRRAADHGDRQAAEHLSYLLADLGRDDELWAEINAGTPAAPQALLALLTAHGELQRAEHLRKVGLHETI